MEKIKDLLLLYSTSIIFLKNWINTKNIFYFTRGIDGQSSSDRLTVTRFVRFLEEREQCEH